MTGEVVDGGRWRKEKHGFQSLPLYARPNSLIAWGRRDHRPDYDFADGAVFAAYALDERAEASASIIAASGSEMLRLSIRRDGAVIDAIANVPDRIWSLRLPVGMRATGTEGETLAIEEGAHFEVKARGSVRIACHSV